MRPPGFDVFPFYGKRADEARGWRRLVAQLLPAQLADEIRFECNALKIHLTRKLRQGRYAALNGIWLNVGCGGSGKDGWTNLDCFPCHSVNCLWDARRSLPFTDHSVQGIFCEHFLEHLEYTREVPTFLSECYRVLQKGATARFIVPDAERYLRAYVEGGWDTLTALRPLTEGHTDRWFSHAYSTRMELINAIFRQGVEHHFAYDAETLCQALARCGFEDVKVRTFGQSAQQELLLDMPDRASESLYVEATKRPRASV